MARSGFLVLAAAVLVMASGLASALKCWRCSSDASNAAFCKDPFDSSIISEQQKRWAYVDCSFPPGSLNPYIQSTNQRPVCKKVKQSVNDKIIVSRSCYWENIGAGKNDCLHDSTPSHVKIEFCETCTTDGCNGA